MAVDNVGPPAAACRNREFLWGFFEGTIENEGNPFHLGQTECSVIETALSHIEADDSLAIHNPFPSPSIPLAICASYAYSQHPNIRSGEGYPLLLFPAHQLGYVSEFDEFHFDRTLNHGSADSLIPRNSIDDLTGVEDDWGIYTANSGFHLDPDALDVDLGAVFVDLQKPEWERGFDRIEALIEHLSHVPVIFYAGEETPAFAHACDHADDRLDITNDLLATAEPHDEKPATHSHAITREEYILGDGGKVSFRHFPVSDDNLSDLLPKFIELKMKLQEREVAYIEVGRVFNRLTKQPFKPRYWTQQVGQDGYYKTVSEYLNLLRDTADRIGGANGNSLLNYCRVANDVQGHLNDTHKLQSVAFNAVQRANADNNQTTFVFQNEEERQAFQLAMFNEGYKKHDNVVFAERDDLTPTPSVRYVFLYPPYDDEYIYQFPPSKSVAFIHHDVWNGYVERSANDATQNIDADQSTTSLGSGSSTGDHEFSVEDIESDIQDHLQTATLGSPDSVGNSEDDDDEQSHLYDCVLHLSNDEVRRIGSHSQVTTYDPEAESIARKQANALDAGDKILLIGSVTDDIYDVLIDSAHRRDTVRERENLVEEWRNILTNGMEEQNLDSEGVLNELQHRGSNLKYDDAIKGWCDGSTIGPQDSEDTRRVLELFKPGLEGDILDEIHEQVWKGIKHIRLLHRRIGRNVRRATEAEFDPSATAQFEGKVNNQMLRSIMKDVEPVTIRKITHEERTSDV